MLERDFQVIVIKELRRRFPGCVILKNDSEYMQGIPDLTVLWKDRWAMLEVKAEEDSPHQPNQEWYIYELDKMSYAAFIYPANKEEVLDDLQRAFKSPRTARLSKRI